MNDRQTLGSNVNGADFLRTGSDMPAVHDLAAKIMHENFNVPAAKTERHDTGQSHAVASFEKETGLKVKHAAGKLQYYLDHSRDRHTIFQTEDSAPGLQAAREALSALIEAKTTNIEKKFGVSIARNGEDAVRQSTTDSACNVKPGKMIQTRTATLPELIGLEAALERSNPSEQGGEGKGPVKFYFLTDKMVAAGDPAAHYVQSDSQNNRAIFVDPEMLQDVPILVGDASKKNSSGDRYYSIQAIFTHELGHNSEYNMGWQNPSVQDHMANAIGWKRYENPQTHSSGWLIQGKDNRYYKNDLDNCHTSAAWITSDTRGDRLNARGQQVKTVAQAEHIKSVAKWAKYPPATDYFTNPVEEVAEGLMMYRLSAEDRGRLLQKKPQLYWAVKEHDQAEINKAFGQEEDGRAKLIRGIDGLLVPNTSESRAPVEKLESKKGLFERERPK